MPRITSYRHGVPAWVDVTSPDIPASAEFYAGMFGWVLGPDMGPDAGGYRLFTKDGVTVAGLGVQQEGVPPAWTTYVAVDDLDAVTARVDELGGVLAVPPMDLPNDSGRIAFVVDPTGGFLGLFQAGPNHAGSGVANEPGSVVWNELSTRDPDAAMAFLDPLLGWSTQPMDDGGMGYRVILVAGRAVGGVMPMGPGFPAEVPTHWMTYFAVADAPHAADRAVALGGTVIVPPFETPVGTMSVLADPFGAPFAVGAMTAPDDPNAWPD